VGYLCANFSLPSLLGLSVLDLGPMYATDRQTSDKSIAHRLAQLVVAVAVLELPESHDGQVGLSAIRSIRPKAYRDPYGSMKLF